MFDVDEKMAIALLLGFSFDLVESKCTALEELDALKGTTFVDAAQTLLKEIKSDKKAIRVQQKSGLADATDIKVDGEMSVSYGSGGQSGSLILANQAAKNELAQLLGLTKKPMLFSTTTLTHQITL